MNRNSIHLLITFFSLNGAMNFAYEHCVSKAINEECYVETTSIRDPNHSQ